MKEFYLDSCGGGRLHCAIWTPEGEPKAVVQLIHGIAEHIGRYDEFARFLNAHGYVVAADDHMGHGGSVENGVKGYFSGGWLSAVEDEKRLHDEIAAQYPVLPYFKSSAAWARSCCARISTPTRTRWTRPSSPAPAGKTRPRSASASSSAGAHVGETSTSKLVTKLMFGSYNRSPSGSTVGLSARDLHDGRGDEQPENLDKMNKQLPLLFVSGSRTGRRYGQGRAASTRSSAAAPESPSSSSRGPRAAQQRPSLSGHSLDWLEH